MIFCFFPTAEFISYKVCLIVDAARTWNEDSESHVRRLKDLRREALERAEHNNQLTVPPIFLVMNKCDLVSAKRARHKAQLIERAGIFEQTFYVSALKQNVSFRDVCAILILLSSTVCRST